MTELARPDPSWLDYIAPRVLPDTPVRARVAWALLEDPARSNRAVARDTGRSGRLVMLVRHGLEDMGVIPVWRGHQGPVPTEVAAGPVRDALLADPAARNATIAARAGASEDIVLRARWRLEDARELCAYRYGRHDAGCWCHAREREREQRRPYHREYYQRRQRARDGRNGSAANETVTAAAS